MVLLCYQGLVFRPMRAVTSLVCTAPSGGVARADSFPAATAADIAYASHLLSRPVPVPSGAGEGAASTPSTSELFRHFVDHAISGDGVVVRVAHDELHMIGDHASLVRQRSDDHRHLIRVTGFWKMAWYSSRFSSLKKSPSESIIS